MDEFRSHVPWATSPPADAGAGRASRDPRPSSGQARKTVSVVIPTNGSPYLERALESVMAQNWAGLEIVVVVNGISERPHVLDRFPVKVVDHPGPLFPEIARALGVRRSSGELVAFLDHDDIWLPGKLERQVPSMQHPDVVLSHTQYIFRDEHLGQERTGDARRLDYETLLGGHMGIFSSGVIVRRTAYDRVGGFRETGLVGEDVDLYLRLLRIGDNAFVDEPLFVYRWHATNTSGVWRSGLRGGRAVYGRHLREARSQGDQGARRAARRGLHEIRHVAARGARFDLRAARSARDARALVRSAACCLALTTPLSTRLLR